MEGDTNFHISLNITYRYRWNVMQVFDHANCSDYFAIHASAGNVKFPFNFGSIHHLPNLFFCHEGYKLASISGYYNL